MSDTGAPPPPVEPAPSRVVWRRVGLFYGIAAGGAILVALLIWGLRQSLGEIGAVLGTLVTAVLYMPLPLVAGLIVERVARRPWLIAQEWQGLRTRFWRTFGLSALLTVVLIVAILALGTLVSWLAGLAGIPGAGRLVASEAEFDHLLRATLPASAADVALPGLAVVVGAGVVQGILAGLTINGLFAFGEEYGWRGVLTQELRPLGPARASALTGVLWGLWHAPIIVLGHNYGAQWQWGIGVMVAWTVPLSFVLTWIRERTGTVIAPAMLHGAINGVIGIFALLIVGGNQLIALPVGLLFGLTLAVLAIVLWRGLPISAREPAVPGPRTGN